MPYLFVSFFAHKFTYFLRSLITLSKSIEGITIDDSNVFVMFTCFFVIFVLFLSLYLLLGTDKSVTKNVYNKYVCFFFFHLCSFSFICNDQKKQQSKEKDPKWKSEAQNHIIKSWRTKRSEKKNCSRWFCCSFFHLCFRQFYFLPIKK